MSFNETVDVTIQTQTQEAVTLSKIVTKRVRMKLLAGDPLIITVKGNDVFNGNIPANKEVILTMQAQIKDV